MENYGNKWIRGNGAPIKSWIKSVVPLKTESKIVGTFTNSLEILEIGAENGIFWKKFGADEHDGWLYGKQSGLLN